MTSKILVINPYITDFKLYDEWMHPAGLYFLMDILQQQGHQVSYFNCMEHSKPPAKKFGTGRFNFTELEKPALYSGIKRKYKLYGRPVHEFIAYLNTIEKPDIICVGSMMTYWAPGVVTTVKTIRQVFHDIPVIIGGIAAQLIPDYFKREIPDCKVGTLYIPEISHLLNINSLSQPSFLKGFNSLRATVTHSPLLLSLGCPMSCSYCASSVLQPEFRFRDLALVMEEIEYMVDNYGVRDFAFYDDALLYKPDEILIPFLKMVNERNLKIRFHTPNGLHLRFLHEQLLELMIESGFTTLRFGYESSDRRYKKDTSAKVSRDDLIDKMWLLKKANSHQLDTGVYVMGGLKGQTPSQMLDEMEFIESIGIKVKPVFVSPVPGTALFKEYQKDFPSITYDPLWHNDSFFITCLPQWNADEVEIIRQKAKSINQKLDS